MTARNRLLDREIELRRATQAVAEARRRLPPGGVIPQDHAFQAHRPGGAPALVRRPELFAPGTDSLVTCSMMFPRAADDTSPGPPGGPTALLPLAAGPCPSSTARPDQRRLRLLSPAGSTCNRDYLAETADGSQQPVLNVFHRDGQTIGHFWGLRTVLCTRRSRPRTPPRRHHQATAEPA